MLTSEFEYHLLAELISMPDRELAQKIELHIWYRHWIPQPRILGTYLAALKESDTPEEFRAAAERILEASGLEFVPSSPADEALCRNPGKFTCRTPSFDPPGYEETTQEQIDLADQWEPPCGTSI